MRIEDYGLIGDTQTAALVSTAGSIDWACFPRFDSGACFARLLGSEENGYWSLCPRAAVRKTTRRYRPCTLVLETDFETEDGTLRLTDCMPPRGRTPDLVRTVECLEGEVEVRMELAIRFDYGRVIPWVRNLPDGLLAVAGPDALILRTDVETRGEGMKTVAGFRLRKGERRSFVLTWFPSHEELPRALDAKEELESTERWWWDWASACKHQGPYRDAVVTSLIVLKALTYGPTGGIIAAPTSSLPETPGGERNWDYRFCWLRDATLTLYALLLGGYQKEAGAWRDWLLRAAAGDVSQLQIMYSITGERLLSERTLPWLAGYEGAQPVRIGNGAAGQLQLDVYGEVMDVLYQARRMGLPPDEWSWDVQRKLLEWLEDHWQEPDEGIWEVRGGRRHFTYSKIMAWVAFDRGVKSIETFKLEGPVERYRAVRDLVHADVCAKAWSAKQRAFTQSYGSEALDASLLLMPSTGFLPVKDPRVAQTVLAIERELLEDGLVLRYRTDESVGGLRGGPSVDGLRGGPTVDGLRGREGVFLACSFWLADVYNLLGRREEAHALFERLLALRNDLGLLAEEYDPRAKRLMGNFPQAFSHLALVNTAMNLSREEQGPADHRPGEKG